MCWRSKRKPVAKIAKRDIPVKKVIYTDGTAYFNSFNYKTRKVIPKVEIEVKEVDLCGSIDYTVDYGYHSYSPKCTFTEVNPKNHFRPFRPDVTQWIIVQNNCLYFPFFPLEVYYVVKHKRPRRIKVQNFIIPKGTKYYTNGRGEYVSELIKMV